MEYITDSSGRRVAKKVNGAIVKAWLYEGSLRPVVELDASGAVVSRFVYGTNVNVPEYMIKAGVTYRIITDQLGSVRMVVNATTGAVAQEMKYDEFGVVTLDTNQGFTPFGFAGGIYDSDTHLTRFGARDYDAETGRWTSKDPIGFGGGDTNLYGYVLANPVNGIDPEGLDGVIYPEGISEAEARSIVWGKLVEVTTKIAEANAKEFANKANSANSTCQLITSTFNGIVASAWTPETQWKSEVTLTIGLALLNLNYAGWEFHFDKIGGRPARFAPFGNSKFGKWTLEMDKVAETLPHYHRGIPNPKKPKINLEGQGISEHRPWQGGFRW